MERLQKPKRSKSSSSFQFGAWGCEDDDAAAAAGSDPAAAHELGHELGEPSPTLSPTDPVPRGILTLCPPRMCRQTRTPRGWQRARRAKWGVVEAGWRVSGGVERRCDRFRRRMRVRLGGVRRRQGGCARADRARLPMELAFKICRSIDRRVWIWVCRCVKGRLVVDHSVHHGVRVGVDHGVRVGVDVSVGIGVGVNMHAHTRPYTHTRERARARARGDSTPPHLAQFLPEK